MAYGSMGLHSGTGGRMEYVRSSRSASRVSLRTQSRAPLTLSRLCSYYFYVKTHPRHTRKILSATPTVKSL